MLDRAKSFGPSQYLGPTFSKLRALIKMTIDACILPRMENLQNMHKCSVVVDDDDVVGEDGDGGGEDGDDGGNRTVTGIGAAFQLF